MRTFVESRVAWTLDFAMCVAMNVMQRRHRLHSGSRAELEKYIAECERLTLDAFYAVPPGYEVRWTGDRHLTWLSPARTPFAENNRTHVDYFPCGRGPGAPTVFMLHALMSTSYTGYREWAHRFNELGWNACFIHLPYHYSRKPEGFLNGELAITADLVRTAEGLRQGVVELRQLMRELRTKGCAEFGLWASSYGGWIGALLGSVERDFRFLALMEPIVDIEHAIWESAAARHMRAELKRAGIDHPLVERHFHLTSPMHQEPLCGGGGVLFAAGDYDRIARLEDIGQLHRQWSGSELLRVPQGHFGHRMMPAVFARLKERGLL